ncbi:NADPH-dependent oxidoreductase [Arsenicitalea aurantiaca]|uniref:NADPH-dependent oxidoreductase n=1 Tax=Arsenicitalea aurantiaca TaxID=1783274 RepID=A0A433XM43_9HYPH|nr:NAD(P)H-dependent oxidoreductase [Arsenicitalea aurantiaca]RUT35160.1 NADPH-dependent oxidoreductase [Arsenicitalea aurantiaca]
MSKLKIAVILGSTRDARFGEKPAQWIFDLASKREDLDVELLDLRDFDLPFFNEVASNAWAPSTDPKVIAWQKKVAEFDGYIFVTAEYNRSITAALKNALDQAYVEWNRKAAAYVGYGSVGGARAIEHLRNISVELQMVPVRSGVHIGGSEFFTVWGGGKNEPMSAIEGAIGPSANDLLDQLTWWTRATKTAREAS